MSTELETSYGGVDVRGDELLVITPAGKKVTGLPKGGMEAGETPEQVAAREVREEAGVQAELVEKLGDVRYWYQRDGRRIAKVVSFYLFDYRAGDVADHDAEVEEARWVPLEEAVRQLTYRGEREMVERALERVRR
jgi:8-oxo-dGTP pyrophosphatase MutT (NUDIX family)